MYKIGSCYRHEHEYVKQDDGSIAYFTWNGQCASDEWKFVCYVDDNGFIICDKTKENEFAKEMCKYIIDDDKCDWIDGLELDKYREYYSDIGNFHIYYYNYPMASRGGFIVVDKDDINNILRFKNVLMG